MVLGVVRSSLGSDELMDVQPLPHLELARLQQGQEVRGPERRKAKQIPETCQGQAFQALPVVWQWERGEAIFLRGQQREPRKGGGIGKSLSSPQEILPAPPSVAQGHSAFLEVPLEKEARERHLNTIRGRLRLLVQARDVGHLARKPEDQADVAEIACLKHMIFVAQTPLSSQVSAT